MWGNDRSDKFGGGGFMSQHGEDFGSASQGQKETSSNKTRRSENVVPVTVAYIHHCFKDDDKVKIGHVEISTVTIIGLVRRINKAASSVTYDIDDLTGKPITVKYWLDSSSDDQLEPRFQPVENTYVRVTGHVRKFQGNCMVTALKVKPLINLAELTMHLLEIIHTKMSLEKGLNYPAMDSMPSDSTMLYTSGLNNSIVGKTESSNPLGLNAQQQMVYKVIKADSSTTGCNINAICKQLSNLSRDTIKKATDFMTAEGHIYTTVDEDHFRATE